VYVQYYSISESVLVQYWLQHCFQHLIGQSVQEKRLLMQPGGDSFSQSNVQRARQRRTTRNRKYGLDREKDVRDLPHMEMSLRGRNLVALPFFTHLMIDTCAAKD
jgi:hypothetical protein